MQKWRRFHYSAVLLFGLVLFAIPFSQQVALAGTDTLSGDVTLSDPTGSRVDVYCSSNVDGVHYDVARFTYTGTGSITITVTAPASLKWYVYQNAYFPASPCANYWGVQQTGSGAYNFTMSYGSMFDVLIAGYNGASQGSWTVTVDAPGTLTLTDPNAPPPSTPPTISTQPGSPTITHNQTTTLSVVSPNATSYQWYQGASGNQTSPIGGATSSSYTTPALAASGSPYQYWVKLTNADGSTNSNTATVTVNKANTATTINNDTPDPSNLGQQVTVSFMVTSGAGTPGGMVTVSDGTDTCTGVLSFGTGNCNIIFSTIGTHTMTATYAGDANFNGSTSAGVTHTVDKLLTTTTITADTPDPSVVGQPVSVSVSVTSGLAIPTGTVTVSDGVDSCSITLIGGSGSCNLTLTTLGARTLIATYAGNSTYYGSTSSGVSHNVKADTTTTITADTPDPSNVGQAVTVNFTVASGSGTPTGSVTVSDGVNTCSGTLTGGTGTCNVTLNTLGARTLTATYAGDANFNASTSSGVSHNVKADTTTTITADTPDPSVVGQAVNVSVSVTSGAGTPTGTVSVGDGVATCNITLSGGTGTCNVTLNTLGARTLTASYSGDANFNASASAGEAHQVNPAATTTTITGDVPDPSVVGQAVTFTYSVSVNAPGAGTPTGTVTVSDGTNTCSDTIAAGGCLITFNAPGSYNLTATYSGDANFNGSTSAAESHQVNQADTVTTITADTPDPSTVGQTVTISFSVAVNAPGTGTPTGSVTVSDGTHTCSASVAAGSCTITYTSVGSYNLTASYGGDSNFNASASTAESHQVDQAATTTAITSDTPDPTLVGESFTVSFNVTSAGGTPTGSVTVSDGVDSCSGGLTGGTGSCVLALSTDGARTLTATYNGDTNFSTSASAGEGHTVNFGTSSINPTTVSVTENTAGTSYSIGLDTNPTGTVTVQISFDAAQLTVNGSSASPITVNLNSTTPQNISVVANDNPVAEGARSSTISHAITSGTAEYPTSLTLSDVTVNVSDDDVAGVTVNPNSVDTNEDGTAGSYQINLNTPPTSGSVTIDLSFDTAQITVNGSGTSPVTLTFSDSTPQTVTVNAVDNGAAEGDRTSTITHAITGGPAEYTSGISISDVTVNVLDDDTPGVRVSPSRLKIENKGDTGTYTLALKTEPTSGSVTISITFNGKLLEINGSRTSPVLVALSDTTPATITVKALDDDLETRIRHAIQASGAPEYPTSMSVGSVIISLDNPNPPPPPPVPNARDWNFVTDAPVRVHVPHHLQDWVFVRLIVENGNYVVWFGSELYDDGNIGNLDVLNHNILQAVDVFTQDFVPAFDGDVVVCLRGMGEMIFMDANEAPRVPRPITAWMTPAFPGYTCATLYTPGALVLVEGQAPTIMATEEAPMDAPVTYESKAIGCYLMTLASDYVNLRELPEADSAVVTVIPPSEVRWTTEYANGFYKVQYGTYIGWLHESAVVTADTCGGNFTDT